MREHQIGSLASHWRTTAALIAVGLGLLSAIPTGGSGLIAGVAAGAAVLGTAYSLATLYDDYQVTVSPVLSTSARSIRLRISLKKNPA